MHSTVVVLLSLFCIGWSKDITLGNAEGRKIFDEVRQANPAIWRQYENVTVIAPDNELISRVVVTDMRPEKDGDVQIINGGDGQKSVTIELKSPTVLRGYEFHIEVYSMPDTVATDAEEHLYTEGVTPEQSNESTQLPDVASKDNQDDLIQSNESTELPDSANSKDTKDFPTLVSDDVQNDNNRPARKTEETEVNNSQIDVPEDEITGESSESVSESAKSASESEEDSSIKQDMATESPVTPTQDTVAGGNPDSIRPARETVLRTVAIASEPRVTISNEGEETTEAASETPVTDATNEVNDSTTRKAVDTTPPYEQATFTPVAYDNTKNIPDYASLNILDYIKNRESLRSIRRTGEEERDENVGTSGSTFESTENNDQTTSLGEETSSIKPDDGTFDLLPHKIEASYNTDYADVETTANSTEQGYTMNNVPRAGRGIDFVSDNEEEREENVGTSGSTFESNENNDQTTSLGEETSSIKPDDGTVDLLPPKIEESYNTDFADVDTTANPTEQGSTMNNVPRAGRGIAFVSVNEEVSTPNPVNTDEESSSTLVNTDDESSPTLVSTNEGSTPTPVNTDEESTPIPINTNEETSTSPVNVDLTTPTSDDHTIISLGDKFRNTRGADTGLEAENDVNIAEETSQGDKSNEEDSGETDVKEPKRNVIIVNLEEFIARDENNRFMYSLPIVLVINSENSNYPIIKIIAENASNDRDKELFPTLSSNESLEPSEFDYKIMDNDRIKGDMPSGDYDQSQ